MARKATAVLVVGALSLAGLAAVTASNGAAPPVLKPAPSPTMVLQPVADPDEPPGQPRHSGILRIEAADADIRVNTNNGRVRVDAPYAFVDVNPDRGRAVVRAPGFNLNLSW